MYVVLRNGLHFLETDNFQHACSAARKDAIKHKLSFYSIFDKGNKDKPLYKINEGVSYNIPNLSDAA